MIIANQNLHITVSSSPWEKGGFVAAYKSWKTMEGGKKGARERKGERERVLRENVSWPRSRVTTLRTVGSAPFVVVEEGPLRVSLSFITRIVVVHEYIRMIVCTDNTKERQQSGRVRAWSRACTRSRTTEPSSLSLSRVLVPFSRRTAHGVFSHVRANRESNVEL